jgi:hypothetical protein
MNMTEWLASFWYRGGAAYLGRSFAEFWAAVLWPTLLTTLVGSALLASTKSVRSWLAESYRSFRYYDREYREKKRAAALNPTMPDEERQGARHRPGVFRGVLPLPAIA